MKKIFKSFYNHIFLFLGMIAILTLIPYLISYYFIAPYKNTYQVSCTYDTEVNYQELVSYDSIYHVKNEIIKYREEVIASGKQAPYSDFSYLNIDGISNINHINIKNNHGEYTISISIKYFNSKAQARRFIKGLFENKNVIGDAKVEYISPQIIEEVDSINNYTVLWISLVSSFFVTLILFIIFTYLCPNAFGDNIIYDNNIIYRSVFHLSYWKKASNEMKTVKNLVTISILFALQLATKFITIPSGFSNLGIGLGYLVFSIIALLYGPIVAVIIGCFSDILGFIIHPNGIFFLGYTLSAMLAGFIYGITLYKQKITLTRCLFARLIVNLFINSVLGSIWWYIVSGKSISIITYMCFTELPKNIAYLIPQSLLMFIVIKVLSRVFKQVKALDPMIADNITLF